MKGSLVVLAAVVLVAGVCWLAAGGALAWRKRRAARAGLSLMGAWARVEQSLSPEGAVVVRGELWPARSRSGVKIESGARVRVVGAKGHRLEVESIN